MSESTNLTETEAEMLRNKIRFEQELEFVQSLANVDYLYRKFLLQTSIYTASSKTVVVLGTSGAK